MTQDGRLIETDPVALGVWRRLTSEFATWRLIVFSSFTVRIFRQFSNDQLTPLMKATHWKIGLGLLGGLSNSQVEFLRVFARLNAERGERIFRWSALILVSLPVAGALALNEIDPTIWGRVGFDLVQALVTIIGIWIIFVGAMMAGAWRARDLSDLLEFEYARRVHDTQCRAGESE